MTYKPNGAWWWLLNYMLYLYYDIKCHVNKYYVMLYMFGLELNMSVKRLWVSVLVQSSCQFSIAWCRAIQRNHSAVGISPGYTQELGNKVYQFYWTKPLGNHYSERIWCYTPDETWLTNVVRCSSSSTLSHLVQPHWMTWDHKELLSHRILDLQH